MSYVSYFYVISLPSFIILINLYFSLHPIYLFITLTELNSLLSTTSNPLDNALECKWKYVVFTHTKIIFRLPLRRQKMIFSWSFIQIPSIQFMVSYLLVSSSLDLPGGSHTSWNVEMRHILMNDLPPLNPNWFIDLFIEVYQNPLIIFSLSNLPGSSTGVA